MNALVRCLQTGTAAAALFALLGACGLTPLSRGPRVRPQPWPPRNEVTIRSLTGAWLATVDTADGPVQVHLSLVQSGNSLAGTLTLGGRSIDSDPAQPAFLGSFGEFTLGFGRSHERVVVTGRPTAGADRLSGMLRRIGLPAVAVTFRRP